MSVNPYLPEGVQDLPAQRFILAALGLNQVVLFDESEKQGDGTSFTARWESQSLSRDMVGASLIQVAFRYTAEADTSLLVEATANGVSWAMSYNVPIFATSDEIRWGHAFFNSVTGVDLRFRFVFNTDVLVNIYSFIPRLVVRGAVEFF